MPRPVPGPVERRWVGSWRRRGEEGGYVMDKQSKTKNCPVMVQQTRGDDRWTHDITNTTMNQLGNWTICFCNNKTGS